MPRTPKPDPETLLKRRRKLARYLAAGMKKSEAGKAAGFTGPNSEMIRRKVNNEIATPEFMTLLRSAMRNERLTWDRLARVANDGLNRPWDEKGPWFDRVVNMRKLADEVEAKSGKSPDPSIIIYNDMVSKGMMPEGEIIDAEKVEGRVDQETVWQAIKRDRKRKAAKAKPAGEVVGGAGSSIGGPAGPDEPYKPAHPDDPGSTTGAEPKDESPPDAAQGPGPDVL